MADRETLREFFGPCLRERLSSRQMIWKIDLGKMCRRRSNQQPMTAEETKGTKKESAPFRF